MKRFKPVFARLQFIDNKIRNGEYPNARSLADEYEVSERTMQRDLEYMRDNLDCPIEYDAKKKGYYYTEPSFSLPSVQISESELFALSIAERALELYRSTPLYDTLAKVFNKIIKNLPEETGIKFSWINQDITFMQKSYTTIDPSIWEDIAAALYTHAVLRITHRKAGAERGTSREAEPYHMTNFDGEWYLIAYCRTKKTILTFAISRIERAERLRETFTRANNFNLEEYLGEHFGIIRENLSFTVEIEFNSDAAQYIRERIWHEKQTIIEKENGKVILSFKSNSLTEVKRWVLGWGAKARVIAPKNLVLEIQNELKELLSIYD